MIKHLDHRLRHINGTSFYDLYLHKNAPSLPSFQTNLKDKLMQLT